MLLLVCLAGRGPVEPDRLRAETSDLRSAVRHFPQPESPTPAAAARRLSVPVDRLPADDRRPPLPAPLVPGGQRPRTSPRDQDQPLPAARQDVLPQVVGLYSEASHAAAADRRLDAADIPPVRVDPAAADDGRDGRGPQTLVVAAPGLPAAVVRAPAPARPRRRVETDDAAGLGRRRGGAAGAAGGGRRGVRVKPAEQLRRRRWRRRATADVGRRRRRDVDDDDRATGRRAPGPPGRRPRPASPAPRATQRRQSAGVGVNAPSHRGAPAVALERRSPRPAG